MSGQVSQSRYCYLTTSIVPTPELKVACAGKEYCDSDFLVARSGFPCFGLEFVSSGAGNLVLDGRQYPLHAGVLFCYGPGVSHRIVNRADHRMTKYFVDFSGDEAARAPAGKRAVQPGAATQIVEVEAAPCIVRSTGGGGQPQIPRLRGGVRSVCAPAHPQDGRGYQARRTRAFLAVIALPALARFHRRELPAPARPRRNRRRACRPSRLSLPGVQTLRTPQSLSGT